LPTSEDTVISGASESKENERAGPLTAFEISHRFFFLNVGVSCSSPEYKYTTLKFLFNPTARRNRSKPAKSTSVIWQSDGIFLSFFLILLIKFVIN